MAISTNNNNNGGGQFGDTTLTKVFVGGLAWETPKHALRDHFEKYGQILEAVIISDKLTGRSKGYGFVTFKEAEAAKKACEEPTVMINGRRANCNLASLGARRRTNSPSPSPPPHPPPSSPPHSHGTSKGNINQVQWYYPVRLGTPAPPSPFHHQHPHPHPHPHPHALPFYGYTPTYITADMNYNYNYNYNQKVSYGNGVNGQHVVYPRQQGIHVGGNTMMPLPMYYHYYHPLYRTTETMGVPAAHFFHPTILSPHFAPSSIVPTPPTTTGPVGTGECFKRVVV